MLLTPLTAHADHEDVFSTLFLGFGLFILFIIILFFLRIRIEGKSLVGGLYTLATYLTFRQVDNLPYYENKALINTLVIIIPSTVFLLSYLGLRKKFKKTS